MTPAYRDHVLRALSEIDSAGLTKAERVIDSHQGARVGVAGARVLNFCANNYLGLADHPEVVAAAHAGLERWGYGLASVRFICGTQGIHKQLERRLSGFLGTDETILYSSCFDANGGVFETLLGEEDAVISDELNHASIIDGIRLCKARRYRYANCDTAGLEARLREADAAGARFKLVVTDGVFSMDGTVAPLAAICDAAGRHGALVMVDDSHGVGFMGPNGRGTAEHHGVTGRVDIVTGTLGKALGGAAGGYVSGRREIIDLLRQRSRPYLFSNTLPPVVAAASVASIDLITRDPSLRGRLHENTSYFRERLAGAGLDIKPGSHPIVPVMLGDAVLAQRFAARMLEKGVYVVGFFFPVVPHGAARIRTQVSAAHSREDLDAAVRAFAETRKELAA
ncbi:MAG TPA: glycine C-acetyltransferase [Opitutaceae bacterium]|jgi:glycine C-acetyltransferase